MRKFSANINFIVIFCVFFPACLNAQIVLNEISQGQSGTKEYIELVVTGTRTCTDSAADIRGWIIDDNNGWLGAGTGQGIALGCMRFANSATWSKVPYGAIIVIYNDGDKNSSITLPDDATDANHDYVYIVPASSTELENHNSSPSAPSASNYVYPSTGFSTSGNWARVGLANGGDAVIITSPANPGTAHFSFGYGSISNSNNATVYKSTSGTAKCYYLSNNQFDVSASWIAGSSPGNETPGAFNNASNGSWINGLRQFSNTGVVKDTTRLTGCSSVVLNGNTYTVSTILNDTLKTVGGCDSIYHITDIKIEPVIISVTSSGATVFCAGDSVSLSASVSSPGNYTYTWLPGNYNNSTITVYEAGTYSITATNQNGCSATTSQVIQTITPTIHTTTLRGCNHVEYNGITYTTSTIIRDTLTSLGGCDSIYNNTSIVVQSIIPVSQNQTLNGCGNVFLNGTTYTASTMLYDTLQSIGGCDSIFVTVSIRIDSASTVHIIDSFYQGEYYTLPSGINVNMAGTYISVLKKVNGCDSIIHTTLTQLNNNCRMNIPAAFTPNGDGYNDVWKIFSEACFRKCKVSVYNRYGSLVYHSENYNNDWNGKYKNGPLPDATYYYVIGATTHDGRIQPFIGNVTIMR